VSHEDKRQLNKRKFSHWQFLPDNGRKYWIDVAGRHGWLARYLKEVNEIEETIRFYQEIYDDRGNLIEIHEKFPVDKGHRKAKEK